MAQLEKSTQICGCVCIYDFEGLGMKQIRAMSPGNVQRLLTFIQVAMPLRMKEIHFVKQPFIFKMVWSLMKPFVKEKLNKRVRWYLSYLKILYSYKISIFSSFSRCSSMAATWKLYMSLFRLNTCQKITVELCPRLITQERTGIQFARTITTSLLNIILLALKTRSR